MTLRNSLSFLAAISFLAAPAFAQQAVVVPVGLGNETAAQENAEERILTSVKIKMRAQSISASSCHLQAGIQAASLSIPMESQIAEFEDFVSALTVGDPNLNINGPEEHKKTLRAASLVTDAWGPVKGAAEKIAAGNGQAGDTDLILTENLEILHHGHNFTAQLVRQYANPAKATLADLLTIVMASRQGMLSQKISKESCMVAYSGGDAVTKLAETMSIYESTLYALRDGLPAAGIAAAPTKEIAAELNEAAKQWQAVKPVLLEIKSGADISQDVHAAKMQQLDALTEKMLEVSTLYVEFTKSKSVLN